MTHGAIGWYVHHHGFGHVARFLAVTPHLRVPVVAFSSLPAPQGLADHVEWMRLPADDDPIPLADGSTRAAADAEPTPRGRLHWAPLGHAGHRRRMSLITRAIDELELGTFVVDVSAEVTALVRLLGARTVVFTQPGERTDAPHDLAFDLADRIIAPWAAGTVPATALESRRQRTVFTGGISRFEGRATAAAAPGRRVVFLGRALPDDVLRRSAARLTSAGWNVQLVGTDDTNRLDDPWPELAAGGVVISAAGQNSVADLAAAGARAVVIAQPRPFSEQASTAATLARLGLARVARGDVDVDTLVTLVDGATRLRPDWGVWRVAGSAARAARAIADDAS